MAGGSVLAAEFAALNESIIAFTRGASPLEWRQTCVDENWAVGGVIRHIAAGYVTAVQWVDGFLEGKPIPIVQDEIDLKNHLHAAEYAKATMPQTIDLLVADGASVVRLIGGLSEEQLAISHQVLPGREITTAQLVKILIRHSQAHFDSARGALSPR